MTYRKILLAGIVAFGLLNLNTQCDKGRPYTDYGNTFKETVGLTPYKLNYRVGDTIWLSVNIPGKKLLEEKSNERIFVDGASFTSYVRVDLLYNNPFVTNGPFVTFIFPTGVSANSSQGGGSYASITYGCTSVTDYQLLLGMVLIEKGAFSISFQNTVVSPCAGSTFAHSRMTFSFDVADTHKDFYEKLPFASVGKVVDTYVLRELERKTMVAINVQ